MSKQEERGEEVLDFFFWEPNGNNVGLKVKKEGSPKGYTLKNLNGYYLQFIDRRPHSIYSFEITEYGDAAGKS